MIDLPQAHLNIVKKILKEYLPHTKVCAFGSRVTGRARPFSDLDLVIMSEKKTETRNLFKLKDAFEDSDLPIRVDVIDWSGTSEEFKAIIRQDCVVIQDGK